ncbi:MAG: hypothetical protein ACRD0J_09825, partial [Acidimicrobiales bacterium]
RGRPGARRDLALALAGAAVVGASIGADYLVSLRHLSQDTYLRSYWSGGFVPHPASPGSVLGWAGKTLPALMAGPVGLTFAGVGSGLAVAGAVVICWRRGWAGLALLAAAAAALAGAWSGKYPVKSRLALFLVPVLVICMAAAVDAGLVSLRRPGRHASSRSAGRPGLVARAVAGCLVALVVAQPFASAAAEVVHPIHVSEVRPVLQFVQHHLRPGDVIDLDAGAGDVWSYYASELGLHVPANVVLPATSGGTCANPQALVPPGGAERIWLVFGYHLSFAPSGQRRAYLAHFEAIGHLVAVHRADKAWAYLFDLTGAHPPAPAVRDVAAAPCLKVVHAPPVKPTGLRTGPFGTGRLS